MRSVNLRLWCIAVLTVAVGSWWQLPRLSAQASPAEVHVAFAAGASNSGLLGLVSSNITPPRLLVDGSGNPVEDIIDAAIGGSHSLILRSDGSVWVLGTGNNGQLGLGPTSGVPSLTKIPGLPTIVAVAAGSSHSLALDDAGHVWAWGFNGEGQLGTGNNVIQRAPVELSLDGAVDIAAGSDFSVALMSNGAIWAWGTNTSWQLGVDGIAGRNSPGPVPMPEGFFAVQVAAQARTALALSADGHVVGWGSNGFSQIAPAGGRALPETVIAGNVSAIGVGGNHVVLAMLDGTVRTRGDGQAGQLGTGSPINISPSFVSVPGLSNVVDVAAGGGHSIAVTGNGAIWAWGHNGSRQLGTASAALTVSSPMQVTGVPMTGRRAVAGGGSTFFLARPGSLGVTSQLPLNVSCTAPFGVSVSMTGFNTVSTSPSEIFLVLDESGSITPANFTLLKNFATDFVNAQDIGPNATRVGIVMFASTARVVSELSDNKQALLNAIHNINQTGGNTCIGCGISLADKRLTAPTVVRPNANTYMVVATDGATTTALDPDFSDHVIDAQAASTLFAIGIGTNVIASQINFIASDVPAVQTAFFTPDFESLSSILAALAVNVEPGIGNVLMSFDIGNAFTFAGPFNASSGNVTPSGNHISWSVASLGASTATLNLPLRGLGAGGQLPVFANWSYETGGDMRQLASPTLAVTGCPASIVLSPPVAVHLVGQPHIGNVTVLDTFGGVLKVPSTVTITSGPNMGRSFNVSGFSSTFGYTSNRSGIDELVATLPGSPIHSESVVVAWEVPNSPPSVNISPNQTIALNGSPTATFTVFAFASDDGNIQPLATQWSENGVPVPNGTGVPSLTLTRLAGKYTFIFEAFDGDHTASATVMIEIVDGTPPVITSLSGGPQGDNGWYIGPFTAAWSVEDPESAFTTTDCSAKTFTNDGVNQTATCSATSAGGTSSATVTVNIDKTKPNVTAPAPVTAEATSNIGAIVSYSGENATDALSGIATFSCAPASNSQFFIGTTPITCTAKDAAGNSATALSSVTVRDTTPPTLVMPPDVTLFGTGTDGAVHFYTLTATDAVDPLLNVSCDYFDFLFPYGTTTVTCTATDDYLNQSTGTFSVTVNHPETSLALAVPPNGSVGWPLPISAIPHRTSFPAGPLPLAPVRFVITGPGTSIDTTVGGGLNGIAHFPFTPTERGVYTVSAYYDGNGVLSPAAAGPVTVTVLQRTQLFISVGNGTAGEPLRQVVELIAQPQGTRLSSRPVSVSFGGPGAPPPVDLVTDSNGTAMATPAFAVAGIHTISASFSDAADLMTDAAGTAPPAPTTAEAQIVVTPVMTVLGNLQIHTQSTIPLVGFDLHVHTSLHRSSVPAGPLEGRPVALTITSPSGATTTETLITDAGGNVNAVFPLSERGLHTLVARYAGNAATAPSSSDTAEVRVYQGTRLTVPPVIGIAGADVSLNATLVLLPQNTPLTGQLITFSSHGAQPNPQTAMTDGTGAASVTGTYAVSGDYSVTAVFDGTADYFINHLGGFSPETASALATIAAASTSITVNAPSASLVAGPLTLTATLNRTAAPAGVVANAIVAFTLTGPSPSTAPMTLFGTTDAAGTATTTFEPTERGSYSVSVSFGGDSSLAASTSAPATVNVYQRTQVTLAPVSGGPNRPLAVVATLMALPQGAGLINQAVQFSFGGVVAPQTALTGVGGVATALVTFPSVGSFGGHAVFSNAADFFTDAAGSIPPAPSTAAAAITIADSTPPVITPTITGVLGPNDWYTSNVDVSWDVTDPESGIESSSGCSSSTTNVDGALFTFTCTATSAGGGATRTVTFKRDATAPTLTLPASFTVPATTGAGAIVDYVATRSDATSGVATFNCAPASGTQFAIGTTTVGCTVTDHAGHSTAGSFAVTVSDTIPPVIGSATPSISSLSPPNHQMMPITITVAATDNIAPPPVCSIVDVASNEPQNGLGDGDTPNDWLITGPLTLQLRAERSGNGNGRVYTVTVQCVDGGGNTATKTTTVSVPKGKK